MYQDNFEQDINSLIVTEIIMKNKSLKNLYSWVVQPVSSLRTHQQHSYNITICPHAQSGIEFESDLNMPNRFFIFYCNNSLVANRISALGMELGLGTLMLFLSGSDKAASGPVHSGGHTPASHLAMEQVCQATAISRGFRFAISANQ